MSKTITITYGCGHTGQLSNDTGAEHRGELLKHFNCPNCTETTGKLRPAPYAPTRRPFTDYLRSLPRKSPAMHNGIVIDGQHRIIAHDLNPEDMN